ncbi:hypothetical protein SO802_033477 [Lithocarpus litseifolius]|uniref:DUF4283 domain-containing protein n=1 Tax=Lithocarpus litseifolius TaxID=425828 RepID=A0AAW2BDQ5_9ROSI
MECLSKHWSNLSINDREGGGVFLAREKSSSECIIAAKFLTKRALNREAIIRTFNPLWRSKNGFEVRNAGDHVMLFVFDNKEEVDKIFASEPWSFDRHLVLIQRYEKKLSVRELSFNQAAIWVQIHDIPANFMTREIAEELCENVGMVDRTIDFSEMIGGSFMRVRVVIDVALPLCRGRRITLDEGEEGWVSFKYERLPNICYWCGCLNHSDRDCDRWIESDGSLKVEDREYGPWIRAAPSSLNKKSVLRVPGFYEARRKMQRSQAQTSNHGDRAGVECVEEERSGSSATAVETQVEVETVLTERLNECIKCDEVNTAPQNQVTYETNKEVDCLEKQIKEIDDELKRYEINDNNYLGDLGDSQTAQKVTARAKTLNADQIYSEGGTRPSSQVPCQISRHVTAHGQMGGKNPKQRTWTRFERDKTEGCNSVVAVVPAKRVIVEDDEGSQGPMSLLCWNCRGLGNPETGQELGDLIRAQDPSVVFLAETWLKKARLEEIRAQYKFGGMIEVSREGKGGGVVLFWKKDCDISMDSYSPNHIDAIVNKGKDDAWRFTGFYGELDMRNHHMSWATLRKLKSKHSLPWICAGDFNEIIRAHEKMGGRLCPFKQMQDFRDVLDECGFRYLGFLGGKFTWCNGQREGHTVWERLDRAVATIDWLEIFSDTRVVHLECGSSDHKPIVIFLNGIPKKCQRPWRFEHMWLGEEGCHASVESAWNQTVVGDPMMRVETKITKCQANLKWWSSKSFGNVTKQLKETKVKLRRAEEVAIRVGTNGGSVEIEKGYKCVIGERREDVEAAVKSPLVT